jgi:hypothetical protein
MDLGDIVVVEKERHPHYGLTGKIVGRRGNRAPGDPWYLVYVMSRGRSYLLPGSTLQLVEKKTDENQNLIWPLTGERSKKVSS